MDRNFGPERQAQLQEAILILTRESCVVPTQFPYFTFNRKFPISQRTAQLLALQIFYSASPIALAYAQGANNPIQRQRALSHFKRHRIAPDLYPEVILNLVLEGPHPRIDTFRVPLRLLHIFLFSLRANRYTSKQILFALSSFLVQVSRGDIDYSIPNPIFVPRVDNMALPQLTISPSLPSFSGAATEDCELFLNRLDRLLAIYPNLTDEQRLFYLENQVSGAPLALLSRELQYLADHPTVPARTARQIYEHVRLALKNSYSIELDVQRYRDELEKRVKLDTETIQDYVQNVLELCRKAQVRLLADKLKHMHKGLNFNLARDLRPSDYNDVPTFLAAVQKLETFQKATLRAHTQHALETGTFPPQYPNPYASKPDSAVSKSGPLPSPSSPKLSDIEEVMDKKIKALASEMKSLLLEAKPSVAAMRQQGNDREMLPRSPSPQPRPYQPRAQSPEYPLRDQPRYESMSPTRYQSYDRPQGRFEQQYAPRSPPPYYNQPRFYPHPQQSYYGRQNDARNYQNDYYRRDGYANNFRANYGNNGPNFYRGGYRGEDRSTQRPDYNRFRPNYPPRPMQYGPRDNQYTANRRPTSTNPSYKNSAPASHYSTQIFQRSEPQRADRPNSCSICSGNHDQQACKLNTVLHQKN